MCYLWCTIYMFLQPIESAQLPTSRGLLVQTMQDYRVVAVLLRCGYRGYYTDQSSVKFCATVYSVLNANIQATNIRKCSYGFRGCFLDPQYNRTNNIMFSKKSLIGLSKWVRDKVVQLFQDCASVVRD